MAYTALPEVLDSCWTLKDSELHDLMVIETSTLADEGQLAELVTPLLYPGMDYEQDTAACAVIDNEAIYPEEVIAIGLPFANDWGLNMALRHKLFSALLPMPSKLVIFPNNTKGDESVYDLSDQERAIVAAGDFAPIARRQINTLHELGAEVVQYMGYSQGASVGAAFLRIAAQEDSFILGPSALFEAPNVTERSPHQLGKAFRASGTKGFNKTIRDSRVPALTDVQHANGGIDQLRQYKMLLDFWRSLQLPINKAIQAGFGHNTFHGEVSAALSANRDLKLTIGRGALSQIMPESALSLFEHHPTSIGGRLATLSIDHYGHELADNIVAYSVAGRLALFGV